MKCLTCKFKKHYSAENLIVFTCDECLPIHKAFYDTDFKRMTYEHKIIKQCVKYEPKEDK
jgi:hypothetical protein